MLPRDLFSVPIIDPGRLSRPARCTSLFFEEETKSNLFRGLGSPFRKLLSISFIREFSFVRIVKREKGCRCECGVVGRSLAANAVRNRGTWPLQGCLNHYTGRLSITFRIHNSFANRVCWNASILFLPRTSSLLLIRVSRIWDLNFMIFHACQFIWLTLCKFFASTELLHINFAII